MDDRLALGIDQAGRSRVHHVTAVAAEDRARAIGPGRGDSQPLGVGRVVRRDESPSQLYGLRTKSTLPRRASQFAAKAFS